MNSRGTLLCNIIAAVTSPAKMRAVAKSGMHLYNLVSLAFQMNELAGRFSQASNKHKEKLMKMEELKTKVELFEGLSEKLQSFIDEKNQALSETEAPRKDVSEVSQYMQVLHYSIWIYSAFLM